MPLRVLKRVDMGASHALLHVLTWSFWSGSGGAEEERATSVLRWQGQPGRRWQGPTADVGIADVRKDRCTHRLVSAWRAVGCPVVGKGLGRPAGADVAVQKCGRTGVGAPTHVADAVCTWTTPGGLGKVVMGPAVLQSFSVHSAWNGRADCCQAGCPTWY